MAPLASTADVGPTCLRILRSRGYALSRTFSDDEGRHPRGYRADKDGFSFEAETALELLGLTGVYEYLRPAEDEPHWWASRGGDIELEILEASRARELAKLRERAPDRFRRLVLEALQQSDCNASAEEILGVSRRELERILADPFLDSR